MICPDCAGPHLYGLTFQHDAACGLYTADTATAAADHWRGHGIRPATPTETRLAASIGLERADGEPLTVQFRHDGIHDRRVINADPIPEGDPA